MTTKFKLSLFKFLPLFLAVFFISKSVFAYPGGITGRTHKTSTSGCSCHAMNTAITGQFSGPTTVVTGQTYNFTLTITMASGSGYEGTDIAVKNGTLAVGSSGLQLLNGELTHSSPGLTYSNPKVLTFSYTAPSTPGTDTLYANAVRGYSGAWNWMPNYGFTVTSATGIGNNSTPVSFGLEQNFPNPFNPTTQIIYNIDQRGPVTLKIYDILGQEVSTLVNDNNEPGSYVAVFNGDNFSSGVYFYKLTSNGRVVTKQMLMIK